MKKILPASLLGAAFLTAAALTTPAHADISKDIGDQKLNVKFFGYSQITTTIGEEKSATDSQDGVKFDADRVRLGYKVSMGKVFSKLQVDFQQNSDSKEGQMTNIIKDAEVGYKFHNAASFKIGQFKTPVGMDFNTSGAKLDITKRGLEKKLVLERSQGAMLSGRKIGDTVVFGYDVGIFNPATRASSVVDNPDPATNKTYGISGDSYAYAVRGMVDWQDLHVELSYGVSEEAAGDLFAPNTNDEDYTVFDIGVSYKWNDLTLKGEYIDGSDIKGENGRDETVWYLHAGYRIIPTIEGVIRHYQADHDPAGGGSSTDLGNTYIGFNYFVNPATKYNARVQVNYVITTGDDGFTGTTYDGVTGGYKDDVLLLQFQVGF